MHHYALASLYALDDVDLAHITSPARPIHRRNRSDPTEINWSALRAARDSGQLGLEPLMPVSFDALRPPPTFDVAPKRDLSPMKGGTGYSPAVKKHASVLSGAESMLMMDPDQPELAYQESTSRSSSRSEDLSPEMGAAAAAGVLGLAPLPLGEPCHTKKEPNYNKRDVPMWTVEEDLLILQLVEQHGKRWSKIAAHLPGRTDNGVRNRWNRMERAQLIKKNRGPAMGYRCRRCGEPKRGHICAARMMLSETPEGEDLQIKAAALTEISAQALKTAVEAQEQSPQQREPPPPPLPMPPPLPLGMHGAAPSGSGEAQPPAAAPAMPMPPPTHANDGSTPRGCALPATVAPSLATPQPQPLPASAMNVPPSEAKSTSFAAAYSAVDSLGLSSNVDDFLAELTQALGESPAPAATPAAPAPSPAVNFDPASPPRAAHASAILQPAFPPPVFSACGPTFAPYSARASGGLAPSSAFAMSHAAPMQVSHDGLAGSPNHAMVAHQLAF